MALESDPTPQSSWKGSLVTGRILRPLLNACTSGWFCLRAEGRREHLAAANLQQRMNVEAFAPRIRVRRETRAGLGTITEALFPGYLFAKFRHPEQTRHVVSTTGVVGLVSFGGTAPELPSATIDYLRQHAAPAPVSPVFEPGDWVRVAAGCFRGTEGRVTEASAGQERVCVLLSFLGHDVEVSLPGHKLIGSGTLPRHVPNPLRAGSANAPVSAS